LEANVEGVFLKYTSIVIKIAITAITKLTHPMMDVCSEYVITAYTIETVAVIIRIAITAK
jgi:hypothetical protein